MILNCFYFFYNKNIKKDFSIDQRNTKRNLFLKYFCTQKNNLVRHRPILINNKKIEQLSVLDLPYQATKNLLIENEVFEAPDF